MGWRFRKTFRLLPGLRLNVTKSGVSESVGNSPVTVNISPSRVRTTVGAPGTGLSYQTQHSTRGKGIGATLWRWVVDLTILAILAFFLLP